MGLVIDKRLLTDYITKYKVLKVKHNGNNVNSLVLDDVTLWHKDYVGLKYTKLEDSSYSIRAEDTSISGDIKIPAIYYFNNGLATSIENKGFYNCNNITSVDIYEGIQYIGNEAFSSCDNLDYVLLPTSVTYIGVDAFNGVSRIYYKGLYDDWYNFIFGLDEYTQSILGNITYVYAGANASHPLPGGGTDAGTLPAPDGFKGYWYYDENEVPATLCDYYDDFGEVNFSVEETLKPTCDEWGYNTWTCNDCGKQWYERKEPLGHKDTDIVYAPTCTEQGYTWHICSRCGRNNKDSYTDALGHSWSDWDVTLEATCTTAGSKTRACTRTCRGVKCTASETETIAATGHNYKPIKILPTCTTSGYTEHTCSRCGDSYTTDLVKPLGHDYKTVVIAPTCTAQGYTEHICNTCGHTYKDNYTAALGHIEVIDKAVAATCTTDGKTEGKHCSRCGAVIVAQSTVPRLGHLYERVIKAPTCTEGGYDLYTCSRCGDDYKINFTMVLGHNWVDATCTTPKTCSRCDATEGEALGHAWGLPEITQPNTCTTAGRYTYRCTICNTPKFEVIPATGHKYTSIVRPPTCTEQGYTEHTCHCGDKYVDSYTEALGHISSDWIIDTEATETAEGSKHKECTRCGVVLETATIPMIDNSIYLVTEADEYLTDEQGNLLIL